MASNPQTVLDERVDVVTDGGFSTREVCDRAGITYRQVHYWHASGVIVPSLRDCHGSGTLRRWSVEDVLVLKVLGQLSALGLNTAEMTTAVPGCRAVIGASDPAEFLVIGADGTATPCGRSGLAEAVGEGGYVVRVPVLTIA